LLFVPETSLAHGKHLIRMPQYNLKPDGIKGFEDFSRCP